MNFLECRNAIKCIKKRQKLSQANFEGDGDGDWVAAFKAEGGPWTGNKLVVLSLFDGIGGIWQALTRLGIPFIGYSSEVVSRLRYQHIINLCVIHFA